MQIKLDEAIKVAKNSAKELFQKESLKGIQFEESNPAEKEDGWLITLSLILPDNSPESPLAKMSRNAIVDVDPYTTKYKVFHINDTGEVVSINIRET